MSVLYTEKVYICFDAVYHLDLLPWVDPRESGGLQGHWPVFVGSGLLTASSKLLTDLQGGTAGG